MKLTLITKLFCVALLFAAATGCNNPVKPLDYTSMVDPFIGTGGHGHTFPGAVVPNGMIQPGPDTRIYQWDACSGYHYSDSTINGFSHTHLSGTGCGDMGDVLLMPTVGEQQYQYLGAESQRMAYASEFSHENESATPGYYSVFLERYGVRAELTSSARAAIHRYTFPKSDQSGFILDVDYSLQNQQNDILSVEVISDTEIRGSKKTKSWAFDHYVHFYAKFSKPFEYKIVEDTIVLPDAKILPRKKVLISFSTEQDEQVFVKVGVSGVDTKGAQQNVDTEIAQWDFDGVKNNAHELWNKYLSKIDVQTTDEKQLKTFYTAMYHTAIAPSLYTDADGRYLGMDLQIHQGDADKPVYTTFSLWDTFRALHPLLTIIDPELNNEFIRSLIKKHEEGGVLPMWDLASNYTGTMIGYHAVSVIVDAYMKGSRDFDVQKAYQACLRVAEYDTTGIIAPGAMIAQLMPPAKYYKNTIGYVPCDKDNEAVAKALEYAYNDWCIAQFAQQMGDTANAAKYSVFAEGYKHYFDPSTRFMRGKDLNGKWRTPFSARSSNHRSDDYCEGTAWQWTWFVPHDIDALVGLMGGREPFIAKLDSLFTADSGLEGDLVSADISGLIGQYAHGNEPSHHIIHMYNYVGQPWKTQQLIDEVLTNQYFADVDGVSGNEDCGQMSAWYILNSMGFYQICPGKPLYSIGRPLFDKVTINLAKGAKFTIIAKNNSPQNRYISSATLNSKPLEEPFFTHDDIMAGGELVFEMTGSPTQWGVK